VNLLLVDDHALFREGLKLLLAGLDSQAKLEEAGDLRQALKLAADGAFDLILLDLKMPGPNGLEALATLRDATAGAPIVVLSGEDDPVVVRAAIEHGAMGFIPKSSTPEVLIQALRLVLARGVYLPPLAIGARATAALPSGSIESKLPGITDRQMDVLRCVIQGKPNKVIARDLDISEGTVKLHLSAVFRVLDVHNRTEAVYAAAKLGLRLV
jgi:DNA-binding NarL/FixJ family response regulator